MMNPGMKMLMLDRGRSKERYPRSEYGGDAGRRMIGYDRDYETENHKYRDNRGRYAESDGWEGNRMAHDGVSNYADANRMPYDDMGHEPESRRRRDSRGRYMEGEGWQGNRSYPRYGGYEPEARQRRDRRGRYALAGDYEGEDDDYEPRSQSRYPPYGNMPPMNMHHPGNSYGDIYAHGTLYAPGAMNKPMGQESMQGDMSEPVDEHTARMWVQKMDGGEFFKIEQTEQQRNAICPECGKWEFYVAMNAKHSDDSETAKKFNIDRPDYYAHLAKDFLKDKDAGPHKLRKYMTYIPK